jgi:two-component system chemotaxis sensor kinase CheA
MSDQYSNESLMEMFLFETSQLLEQLEQSILSSEKESDFSEEAIDEIFRIMHTIKGSSAMMLFDNIAKLAHSIEDLFFYLRKEKPAEVDCSALSDLVLEGVDFIKTEVEKIKDHNPADGKADELVITMKEYLEVLKQGDIKEHKVDIVITSEEKASEGKEPSEVNLKDKEQCYINNVATSNKTNSNAYKAIIHFDVGT